MEDTEGTAEDTEDTEGTTEDTEEITEDTEDTEDTGMVVDIVVAAPLKRMSLLKIWKLLSITVSPSTATAVAVLVTEATVVTDQATETSDTIDPAADVVIHPDTAMAVTKMGRFG